MTLDKSNTDKLAEFSQRSAAAGHQGRAALDQCAPASISRCIRTPRATSRSATRWAPSRASARVRRRRSSPRGADGPFRISPIFAGAARPARGQQAHARKPRRRPAPSTIWSPTARASSPAIESILDFAHRAQTKSAARARARCFRASPRRNCRCRRRAPWPLAERLQREFDSVGFFLSGHPLDAYAGVLQRLRVQRWADFARAVKQGASSGRLAATVLDRAERRTKSGSKWASCSCPTSPANMRRSCFRRASTSFATCWKRAPRCC